MRKQLLLLLFILMTVSRPAAAQEPQVEIPANAMIEQVEISGIPEQRLSQTLRDELQQLVGRQYDPQVANEFADRIQTELPEFVAASRIMAGTQPDRIRLIFAVARISDRDPLGSNVNARYTVESVDIEGIERSAISETLWADLQKMIGQQLDDAESDRLREAFASALPERHVVEKRVMRGSTRQFVRVVYEVYKLPLLPFREPRSFLSYHQKLGVSFAMNVSWGPRGLPGNKSPVSFPGPVTAPQIRISVPRRNLARQFTIGAANSADDLIERYKGIRLGFEQVTLGTEHLGVKLDYTAYGTRWQRATELASQQSPDSLGLYRSRRTIEPTIAFALTPTLYATAGLSIVDLEMQFPDAGSRSASAGIGSLRYRQTFESGETDHTIEAGYGVRTGSRTLESDYIYTRHFFEGRYAYSRGDSTLRLGLMGGRTTGKAPLFDRFSLGNTQTLRGWNKFDLAPLGGDRLAHGSLEYVYDDWKFFYDTGTVWDAGGPVKVRSSVGVGLGDEMSIMIGLRIQGARLRPAFMVSGRLDF